jgi:hypothetical protein
MMKIKLSLLTVFCLACHYLTAQVTEAYNIVWTTPGKNASESMPCGGGDIGMNVWVEKGELLIYIARSGNFDENNALLKSGRIRIKLSPNPFEGKIFKQELHLREGYVTVYGEGQGVKATVKIWADVFSPVAHIDINSNQRITAEASYESWRYQDRILKSRENFGNSWKWAAPKNNIARRDEIVFDDDGVLFYHYNQDKTIFDATVEQQGMDAVKDQLYNPLRKLAFGGFFGGKNFIATKTSDGVYVNTDYRAWTLKSKTVSRSFKLDLYLHTAQVEKITIWKQSVESLRRTAMDNESVYKKTQQWWQQFWDRSFITIDKAGTGSKSWEIGRNYQLFRYMLACNAHGKWPTKFNGGLLTVDPVFTDTAHKLTPDYRNWGGGLHAMQNQRLVYHPMIKSGDWDMLQAQLEFYLRIVKNAELRSKVYWNHGGACFTEQMENYGLPDYAEYGQNRPADFDKGLEYNAWLEYEWDTVFEFCLMMLEEEMYTGKDIGDKIFFIESCLQFFDEHYQYLAKKRGRQSLDGEGKLVLYPGSGAETYKMANNATSTIAALQTITKRLLQLPTKYISNERKEKWESLLKRIPAISYTEIDNQPMIAPAKTWERINNTESPQLYPVFPWRIYGVGKPGLDTALNTWKFDTSVIKFRHYIGWKQDNIWAAGLGLTNEAWDLTSKKLASSGRRFPAFWGPGYDWVPDHNWGGSGMIGLQEMLLQTEGKKIILFPAWPKDTDVHFKLHAPYNTTVEAEMKGGKVMLVRVVPEERRKDVVLMNN